MVNKTDQFPVLYFPVWGARVLSREGKSKSRQANIFKKMNKIHLFSDKSDEEIK